MTGIILTMLFLLAVLALVAVVAQRLKLPPSILLVIAGIALALIPGLPAIELAPELVILVLCHAEVRNWKRAEANHD